MTVNSKVTAPHSWPKSDLDQQKFLKGLGNLHISGEENRFEHISLFWKVIFIVHLGYNNKIVLLKGKGVDSALLKILIDTIATRRQFVTNSTHFGQFYFD